MTTAVGHYFLDSEKPNTPTARDFVALLGAGTTTLARSATAYRVLSDLVTSGGFPRDLPRPRVPMTLGSTFASAQVALC